MDRSLNAFSLVDPVGGWEPVAGFFHIGGLLPQVALSKKPLAAFVRCMAVNELPGCLRLEWSDQFPGSQSSCWLDPVVGGTSCCRLFARGMADGRDGMLHAPITDLPSWHDSLDPGRKLVVCSRPQCGPGKVGQ